MPLLLPGCVRSANCRLYLPPSHLQAQATQASEAEASEANFMLHIN